jgi:ElaB/YqjD/DUF883 family membrane-anchored ribosome-binding protein
MTKQDRPQDRNEEVQSIAVETDETRSRISDDLRAIGEKLTPENIKEGIKAEAREAIGSAKEAAVEKLQDARQSVRHAGRRTLGFVSENGMPLALIGLGVGWLLASRRRTNGGFRSRPRVDYSTGYEGAGYDVSRYQPGYQSGYQQSGYEQGMEERASGEGRAEQLLGEGREKGRRIGRKIQQRARRTTERSREFARESPLAMGAMAAAAGIGLGLMLPITRKEEELLGPTRDRLIGEAKDTAEQIGRTVKETARELKEKVNEPMTH